MIYENRLHLNAVAMHWRQINFTRFNNQLRPPVFTALDGCGRLGQWCEATRTLSISSALLDQDRWSQVIAVLEHEMVHQYVSEVLQVTDETPHGPAFRSTCVRLGIDASASGMPATDPDGAAQVDRLMSRITKLLALAASDNAHEAEAAMATARQLMLRYNLDLGDCVQAYGWKHVGPVMARIPPHHRAVAMVLADHFFVRAIWVQSYDPRRGRHGRVLEIVGTEANLAIAEYVHDFLLSTGERLWLNHRGERPDVSGYDRQAYLSGAMRGFHEKLMRQQTVDQTQDRALVWKGDGDLDTYYSARYPRVVSVKRGGSHRAGAYLDGHSDGQRIVLHRAIETNGGDRGHLLT